jgi:hypothetical protein
LIYLMIAFPVCVHAQQAGGIIGTVKDPGGAALPKATDVLESKH